MVIGTLNKEAKMLGNGSQVNFKQLSVSNTCRTCGTSSECDAEFTELFTSASAVSKEIVDLLRCLGFKFHENDGLPKKMCKGCLQTFIAISEFRKQCERIQNRLLSVFSLQCAIDSDTSNLVEMPQFEVKEEEDLIIQDDLHEDLIVLDSDDENSNSANETQGSKTAIEEDNWLENESEHTGINWECEYTINSDSDIDQGEKEQQEKENAPTDLSELNNATGKLEEKNSNEKRHIKGLVKDIERNETCPYCKNKFARVRIHIQMCPKVNGELCKHCTRRFETREQLKEHIDTMHSEGLPACPICFCTFQTYNQRTNHIRKIHERGVTKCEKCNIDFHSKYYLIKHNKKEHIDVVNRECPECKKVLKTKFTYERHMKAHTDEKLYQCKHCGKGFMQYHNMRIHELKHADLLERSFLCDICGESYLSFTDLRKHQGKKHDVEVSKGYQNRRHECKVCQKVYCAYPALYFHWRKHTEEERKAAPIAERPVKKYDPNAYPSQIKRLKKETFKCTLCPRGFATTYGLEQHLKRHVEKRPFNCEECGNGFKRLTHLKAHIRRIHRKEKRFVCTKCGKGFSENYELLCHARVHDDKRPYKCHICSASFRWLAKLRAHMHIHSGNKPYSCRICGKLFKSCATLKGHSNSHTFEELQSVNESLVRRYEQEVNDSVANDVKNGKLNDKEPMGSQKNSQEKVSSDQEDEMDILDFLTDSNK